MNSVEDLLDTVGIGVADDYGFFIHTGTLAQYLQLIELAIKENVKITIVDMNLHSLFLYLRHHSVREAYESVIAKLDGMPIVAMMRLRGHTVTRDHRITGIDFVWPLFEQNCSRGHRVYCLGNYQPTVKAALKIVRDTLPGIAIDGRHGFFDQTPDSAESRAVIDQINHNNTDVLTVGLSSPNEQLWVAAHRHLIKAPVVITWGACLEYVAGTVSTPPRWMGRWGLEWSYRLFENPRRFMHRYLVEPWALLALLFWHNLFRRRLNQNDRNERS